MNETYEWNAIENRRCELNTIRDSSRARGASILTCKYAAPNDSVNDADMASTSAAQFCHLYLYLDWPEKSLMKFECWILMILIHYGV